MPRLVYVLQQYIRILLRKEVVVGSQVSVTSHRMVVMVMEES